MRRHLVGGIYVVEAKKDGVTEHWAAATLRENAVAAVEKELGPGWIASDHRLASQRPKIAQRLTELRQALAEAEHESNKYAAEALGITKESLIAKYESIAEDARADGQHSAAVSAYKEVSILSGHRIERQEIGTPDDFAAIDAMSRAELVEFILDGIENDIPEILGILLSRQKDVEARAELVASVMSAINGEFPIKLIEGKAHDDHNC